MQVGWNVNFESCSLIWWCMICHHAWRKSILENMWWDLAKWVWNWISFFPFFFFFFCVAFSIRVSYKLWFGETPMRLGNWFSRNFILSDFKSNGKQRNYLFWLALSVNWYLWVPTHFAWLHHKWFWWQACLNYCHVWLFFSQ